jgi:uncharacterized protein
VSGRWGSTSARAIALVLLAASATFAIRAARAPEIVRDAAGLLAPEQRRAIAEQHAFLRRDHGIDYRVETLRGAGDLDRVAVERFEALAVGSAGRGERGLLLVIDADADEVRLEVGYGLEGAFPDAFVAWVEQRQMVPFFQARRVGYGILAATELVVARAQEESARGGFAELPVAGSGGGGARTRARIGEPPEPPSHPAQDVAPGDTPEATVAAYLEAMAARNPNPDLALYSAATRAMLAGWVMTPAQMDTLSRTYRDCAAEPVRLDPTGTRAVIRHPATERRCAPWFLVREDGHWRLDLATASAAIRFGRSNAWHFAAGAAHPYAFAFEDWRFDRNGFPQS